MRALWWLLPHDHRKANFPHRGHRKNSVAKRFLRYAERLLCEAPPLTLLNYEYFYMVFSGVLFQLIQSLKVWCQKYKWSVNCRLSEMQSWHSCFNLACPEPEDAKDCPFSDTSTYKATLGAWGNFGFSNSRRICRSEKDEVQLHKQKCFFDSARLSFKHALHDQIASNAWKNNNTHLL